MLAPRTVLLFHEKPTSAPVDRGTSSTGRPRLSIAGLLVAALAAACSSIDPKPLADWHDAIVAVRDQSSASFQSVNDLVREDQVQRAATLEKLVESDFQPGLDSESITAWNRALDGLAAYGASLTALLQPDLATNVGDSTKTLSESIATTAKSDVLTKYPALSSALGKLASKIAAAEASSKAKEIMQHTDPEIADLLGQMAKMIDDSKDGTGIGILATVHAHWMLTTDQTRAGFLKASSPEDKQEVASRFASQLAERDASEESLRSLKGSLLELATAHNTAANGGSPDTSALISRVRDQIAFLKDLMSDLKPANK